MKLQILKEKKQEVTFSDFILVPPLLVYNDAEAH